MSELTEQELAEIRSGERFKNTTVRVGDLKPMLAAPLEDLADLRPGPWYATPKLDGIRCLCLPELGPVSRKLKPIPNLYARTLLAALGPWLDGEIMVPGAKTFGDVTAAVMRHSGSPAIEFHVFDWFQYSVSTYLERMANLEAWALLNAPAWVRVLRPVRLDTIEELQAFEAKCLAEGYEGVMLRSAKGPYKFGRSTLREGWLLKRKPFADAEAEVIGFDELQRNGNEQERDELGYAKRSTAKAGLVAGGTLGALVVRSPDYSEPFRIGSGFTDADKAHIWANREHFLGQLAKFRHQPHGAKDAPRIPTFLGFRHADDV